MKDENSNLINLLGLAGELQLPAVWLKEQALKGFIPCLFIGKKIRFNVDAVKTVLADLAAKGANYED